MFDIGFWELSLIGIIALLVIGPERLPGVARTVGKYVGKANRFLSSVKEEINKELKDEELKRILAEQQKLADEFRATAESAKSELESVSRPNKLDDLLEIEEEDDLEHHASVGGTNNNKNAPKKENESKEKLKVTTVTNPETPEEKDTAKS